MWRKRGDAKPKGLGLAHRVSSLRCPFSGVSRRRDGPDEPISGFQACYSKKYRHWAPRVRHALNCLMILGCCGCFPSEIQDFYRRKQDRNRSQTGNEQVDAHARSSVSQRLRPPNRGLRGIKPEGLPSLPQACDALITSEGEPLAPTQPSLPLVSANPSLTVRRYNRGETSPREVMRKKPSLSPATVFSCLPILCALFCNARAKKRPKSRHNLNCHRSVTDT